MYASYLKLLAPVLIVYPVGISIQILDDANYSITLVAVEMAIIFLLTNRAKSYAKV